MTRLTDSIEKLESEYEEALTEIARLEKIIGDLESDLADAKFQADGFADEVRDLEEFQDWVFETYPDIKIAYEVRLRLENAANGTAAKHPT